MQEGIPWTELVAGIHTEDLAPKRLHRTQREVPNTRRFAAGGPLPGSDHRSQFQISKDPLSLASLRTSITGRTTNAYRQQR